MLISVLQDFIHPSRIVTLVADGSICSMGLLFYYLSRFKGWHKQLTIPLIIILNAMLVFYWYWLSGVFGPASVGALGVATVSIFLSPINQQKKVFVGFCILLGFLTGSQNYTDWVQISSESLMVANPYKGIYFDYYMVSVAVIFMFFYLKRSFDHERQLVVDQNVDHEKLNNALQATVSEKEMVIKNLKLTQNQLIESEKMASIGHFTSGIAHELNNPMNFVNGSIKPILMNLGELEMDFSDEAKKRHQENFEEIKLLLKNVEDGTRHISGILNNLLKITPSAQESYPKASIDLLELIKNTYHFVQNASPNTSIYLDAKDQILVTGIPVEFNQMILNLIRNSLDATRDMDNGRIELHLKDLGSHCSILIKDNGVGIPKENHSKIFDPFFTTKDPGEGTGVGLYIVYSLVTKYGGEISMESEESVGTTFLITLPLDNQPVVLT